MVLHFLLTKSFFDFFTDMTTVLIVFELKIFVSFCFVFGFHFEIILDTFFQAIQICPDQTGKTKQAYPDTEYPRIRWSNP